MYNEQTRLSKSHEKEENAFKEDTKNTQDAVFDLDNCLQERRSRDDNKDDYKKTIGESKTVFQPSITSKQFSFNGEDVNLGTQEIYQTIDFRNLKGINT